MRFSCFHLLTCSPECQSSGCSRVGRLALSRRPCRRPRSSNSASSGMWLSNKRGRVRLPSEGVKLKHPGRRKKRNDSIELTATAWPRHAVTPSSLLKSVVYEGTNKSTDPRPPRAPPPPHPTPHPPTPHPHTHTHTHTHPPTNARTRARTPTHPPTHPPTHTLSPDRA